MIFQNKEKLQKKQKKTNNTTKDALFFCLVKCNDVNITGLMDTLFENYHKDVRPMCEDGASVNVSIGIALRQVIDLVSFFLMNTLR